MPPTPVRIALWSGPRNVSTALLRSFGSRPDTVVVDEPFYAHYLAETGAQHPGREEVIASQPTDAAEVVRRLFAPLPAGKAVQVQKQMAHHLIPSVPRGWLDLVRHALLIRDPGEVIASYAQVVARPTALDLGYPQTVEILERQTERAGTPPPVVDARDMLADPRGVLGALCAALGVAFDERMLSWEPGPRETDGVWARHWYAGVERSSGFGPPRPRVDGTARLPEGLEAVHAECERHYRVLHALRITTPVTRAAHETDAAEA